MSKSLVKLFQKTIKKSLHLDRQDKIWALKEKPKITLEAPNRHSLGFSLDCKSSPFSSLFDSMPPSDITKMCDGIIVVSHKDSAYIFIVEQKTAHKDAYKKQLTNGKCFCDWLLALLKEHDHYDGEVNFICLLCWQPRENSPRKGGTRHTSRTPSKNLTPCHPIFETKNETDIHLLEFIK